MAWSSPRTWVAAEVVTSGQLNTELRDNLLYLFNVAHAAGGSRVPGSLWSTTSTSLTDWNGATPLSFSFTKRGGTETQFAFTVNFTGFVNTAAVNVQMGVRVGSTDYTNAFPHHFNATNDRRTISEVLFVGGLAAGTYTIKLRCLISAGTFTSDTNDFAQIAVTEVAV